MVFRTWISNSFEDETSSKGNSFPNNNNNYHFRDSSSESDGEISTPTSPISPISSSSPISQSNGTTFNNHNTLNIMQRRASESRTEAIQFKKYQPARRYTLPNLPGKFGLSRLFEPGRDSSVQVAMDNVQFGL